MRREDALQLGEDVLRALEAGQAEWPLSLIREVYVFGSVARGAATPHDLDLCIEHDNDKRWISHSVNSMTQGRDAHTGMRKALRGARRSCQIVFNEHEWLDFEMTKLWQRGENFDLAIERLRSIPEDSEAGRASREAMLPQFDGLDRWIPRGDRHNMHDAVKAGVISVERFTLEDREVRNLETRRVLQRRWAETSPLLRAARAVAAYWEQAGVDLNRTVLHGEREYRKNEITHGAGFSWRYLRRASFLLGDPNAKEWIEVAHPTRTKPLECLRLIALDHQKANDLRW